MAIKIPATNAIANTDINTNNQIFFIFTIFSFVKNLLGLKYKYKNDQ